MIGRWERVLVLAPHTDDGEFGCGGTTALGTGEPMVPPCAHSFTFGSPWASLGCARAKLGSAGDSQSLTSARPTATVAKGRQN
jgi:hypothetical protein